MKISSMTTLAFAALTTMDVTAVSGLRTESVVAERQLQDITDGICTACDVCESFGDLCSIGDIVTLACAATDLIGNDGLTAACGICDSAGDACDPDTIADLGCGFCNIDFDNPDLGGSTCFSEVATVSVASKDNMPPTTTAMKDVKLGDRILTKDGSYQSVYAFGHYHPTKSATFFQIHSDNTDRPLEVTGEHLVFLQGKSKPVPAQMIKVGDVLRGINIGSKVTMVGTVERKGIYAPLTTGGTLLVDDVVASSYVSLGEGAKGNDHDLIHLALSPYRLLCNGVSASFCDTRFYLEDGMPFYVHYGLGLLQWLLNSAIVIKTVGLSLIVVLAGVCKVVEDIFAFPVPLVLALVGTGLAFQKKKQKSNGKVKAL